MHLLIFPLIVCLLKPTSADEGNKTEIVTCSDYREYDGVNVTALQGAWRARELVMHLEERGVVEYKSCPVVNITVYGVQEKPRQIYRPSTEATLYQHRAAYRTNWYREYRHLKLVWDENGKDIEYSLFFKNDSVGYWTSQGEQTGSFLGYGNYQHFTGTVQVLKAVGDHLLLHFCQSPINGNQAQLFSVLLSREPRKLKRWEIDSAHDLLRRKNLSVTTRRLVCGNSAFKFLAHSNTLVLLVVITLLRS